MNPTNPEDIFHRALEFDSPDKQAAYVEGACGSDADLRDKVQKLLVAHAAAEAAFPTEPGDRTEFVHVSEGPGTVIGKYTLRQKLGEGGMGVVYLAEQREPFDKRVALKIIKLGMDTKAVVARFDAERQALALMNHPNIAKVLDAGATETGRPYFVMELVKGEPLTEYCDKHKLSTRERLELFIPVCQAIQHAHQKGIIHRDIKPSNILVALFDGRPVPMVIDFGIAKATNQRLTQQTVFTNLGQLIGTPAYMSPEQAEGSQLDIDTRSDIYSLGVLLYELLTGTQPFPEKRLRSAGWAEMMKIIREEEPQRPSTRLSTLTEEEQSQLEGAHGGEAPRKLGLVMRRELDLVILKCLEKDRSRRYDTANALAMELDRYLKGEPVAVVPPTWSYQISKFARKHRQTVAVATALVAMLTVATVFSTYQAMVADRERALAKEANDEAQKQKRATDSINTWMRREILGLLDAWGAEGVGRKADITLQEVLANSVTGLSEQFKEQPLIEAQIRSAIGKSLETLQNKLAIEQYRQAYTLYSQELGPTDTNTLEMQKSWGWANCWFGGKEVPEFELRHLWKEGTNILEQAYFTSCQAWGTNSQSAMQVSQALGLVHGNAYDFVSAEEWLRRNVDILGPLPRPDNSHYDLRIWFDSYFFLGWLRDSQGRRAESKDIMDKLWTSIQRTSTRPDQKIVPDVAMARFLRSFGWQVEIWNNDPESAENLYLEGLKLSHPLVGAGHPTEVLVKQLSALLKRQGRFADVVDLNRRELVRATNQLGLDHEFTAMLRNRVAGTPGYVADWQGVLDQFAELRSDGLLGHAPEHTEIVALWLTGRTNEYYRARSSFWEQVVTDPKPFQLSWWVIRDLLSLPSSKAEIVAQSEFIESTIRRPAHQWASTKDIDICRGLLRFRQGSNAEAINLLRSLFERWPDEMSGLLAGFALAIVESTQGMETESKITLERANSVLDGTIRSGAYHSYGWWTDFGCVVAMRAEAEETIRGKLVSPTINKELLEGYRDSWKPIHRLLEEASWEARHRRYAKAADLFQKARQNPHFSVLGLDGFFSPANYSCLLAIRGDIAGVEALCNELSSNGATIPRWFLGRVLQMHSPSSEMLDQVVKHAITALDLERRNRESPEGLDDDEKMSLGLYYYRQGKPERALACFRNLTESDRLDFAVTGKAYAALSLYQIGDTSAGRILYQEAKADYARYYVDPSPDLLQPDWMFVAMIEMALEEARNEFESTVPNK